MKRARIGESKVADRSDKRKEQMMSQLFLVRTVLNEVYSSSFE